MELTGFGVVLLFIIGGLLFLLATLGASNFLRPSRSNEEKVTTYESGEQPVGNAWANFNIRFYIVALIFILFEVELVFLFPWATVFGDAKLIESTNGLWGWFSLVEAFIFIGILGLGLAYVWAKGYLDWIKPERQIPKFESKVPKSHYMDINKKYQ